MNVCISLIIKQIFLIHVQLAQDILMPGEADNLFDNFESHKDEESRLEKQNIKDNYRDLVGESSDAGSYTRDMPSKQTPQDRLLGSESSSFFEKEFPASIPVSNINYYHPRLQNNNLLYIFYNQLDYALTHYFVESETMKENVDRFLFEPLMIPLIKKLFY